MNKILPVAKQTMLVGLFSLPAYANPIEVKFINELLLEDLDGTGWAIELDLRMEMPASLDGWFLTTSTDTAYINQGLIPDSTGFIVLRSDSLQSELTLKSAGEAVTLFHGLGFYMDQIRYGDVVDFQVLAPFPGQSLSLRRDWQYYWCIYNTPTLGEENDIEGTRGTISGNVYSTSGSPLSDARIVVSNYLYWSPDTLLVEVDGEGHYSTETTARYTALNVHCDGFTSQNMLLQVWPDSTEVIEFSLSPLVDVDDNEHQIPEQLELMQNYPNPFNTSTIIRYGLPEAARVAIDVFKLDGSHVVNIFEGNMSAGSHEVSWNDGGVPSGIYVYIIQADDIKLSRKMILLK